MSLHSSTEEQDLTQAQVVLSLKRSAALVGRFYPVLMDKQGRVIDGHHRLRADPNWPKIEIPEVKSDEQMLLSRLISNVCRRSVPPAEKADILGKLGRLYLKQGVQQSRLAKEISKKAGMSYRWVMKYLPADLKMRPGLGGPKRLQKTYVTRARISKGGVACLATEDNELFLEPQQRVASLSNYSNTTFVTIILDKQFYLKLGRAASELSVDPNIIINNALILALRKVEKNVKANSIHVLVSA